MQLCALDKNDSLIFAGQALKQHDYQCLECGETVRLRSGLQRQPHFYHIQPNGHCRLHSKGMPHIMLQYHLKKLLPEGEAALECRFPEIGRIADVVWKDKKIVYEIQFSPMTADEALARNRDYATLGYRVVWILHDSRYNRPMMTPLEDALSSHPHFYSNMDDRGEGIIYDQFACVSRGIRTFRLPRLPIDPSIPTAHSLSNNWPKRIRQRQSQWDFGFAGDLVDRLREIEGGNAIENEIDRKLERMVSAIREEGDFGSVPFNIEFTKALLRQWVYLPYRALLRFFLERACR